MTTMLARRQFSLRSLFAATGWLGVASMSARYAFAGNEPIAFLMLPVGLCGAVGVLRGRAPEWVYYGAAIGVVLSGVALLAAAIR
jgi:hypothetical protein